MDATQVIRAYRQQAVAGTVLELWAGCAGASEWKQPSHQALFVSKVIEDPHCKAYPRSKAYTSRVLKEYLDAVDPKEEEVSEALLEAYLAFSRPKANESPLIGDMSCNASPHYRTYPLGADLDAVVRVFPAFSQVGLAVWEAGLALVEHILSCGESFSGQRVV
eukprot:RCo009734